MANKSAKVLSTKHVIFLIIFGFVIVLIAVSALNLILSTTKQKHKVTQQYKTLLTEAKTIPPDTYVTDPKEAVNLKKSIKYKMSQIIQKSNELSEQLMQQDTVEYTSKGKELPSPYIHNLNPGYEVIADTQTLISHLEQNIKKLEDGPSIVPNH